jgi:hypothetical protein
MSYWSDNQAQAQQVGAILLLGFVVIILSIFQSQVVPTENKQVEFEHSVDINSEFQTLRNSIIKTSRTGNPNPTAVSLGTRYPERLFFINPPPATGRLDTTDSSFTFENATLVDDGQGSYDDAMDYWGAETLSFDTETIVYDANYRVLEDQPTYRIEHGVTVVGYPTNNQSRSEQPLINGREITLNGVTTNSDFNSQGTNTQTFEPKITSEPTRTIRITGNNSDPIKLRLDTTLNASIWDQLLENQENVENVGSPSSGVVEITLNGTKAYTLEMSQVGLGANIRDADFKRNRRENGYIVSYTADDGTSVVEARDKFNNPIAGAEVVIFPGDSTQANAIVRTDINGQITDSYLQDVAFDSIKPRDFSYQDLDDNRNEPVWFSVDYGGPTGSEPEEVVSYNRYSEFQD